MDIYLINIDRVKDRLKFQLQQFKKINLTFERISAITIDSIPETTYREHYHDWQRPLRKAEVACYFSHKKVWQKIIENDRPALILEDDAVLSNHTADILNALENNAVADLIVLEVRSRKKYVSKTYENLTKNHDLIRLYQDKAGAAAYVLWPEGAKKLLAHESRNGIALADAHLFSCKALVSYQVEPAAAIQLDQCESYDVQIEGAIGLAKSSISSEKKIKKEVIFILKRAKAQLQLGFRNLLLIFKSKRRYIFFKKEHFN